MPPELRSIAPLEYTPAKSSCTLGTISGMYPGGSEPVMMLRLSGLMEDDAIAAQVVRAVNAYELLIRTLEDIVGASEAVKGDMNDLDWTTVAAQLEAAKEGKVLE